VELLSLQEHLSRVELKQFYSISGSHCVSIIIIIWWHVVKGAWRTRLWLRQFVTQIFHNGWLSHIGDHKTVIQGHHMICQLHTQYSEYKTTCIKARDFKESSHLIFKKVITSAAYRWRQMVLAIRFWFKVDNCFIIISYDALVLRFYGRQYD
jgi:hypothetical protein